MSEEKYWLWKDIDIKTTDIGETITKGKDMWAKDYVYIYLPKGYGYDNYCFLLSEKCVHKSYDEKKVYISICSTMNIELIYDPAKKEENKKYKRHKMTGEELFNKVYEEYEINIFAEAIAKEKKEKEEKEKKDRKIKGKIICGYYEGNVYCGVEPKYMPQHYYSAFFVGENYSTYFNSKFKKVQNVKYRFTIIENVSRYDFLRMEEIINEYLEEIHMLTSMKKRIEDYLKKRENPSSLPLKSQRHQYSIVTDTREILKQQTRELEITINKIKEKLNERIASLKETYESKEK